MLIVTLRQENLMKAMEIQGENIAKKHCCTFTKHAVEDNVPRKTNTDSKNNPTMIVRD